MGYLYTRLFYSAAGLTPGTYRPNSSCGGHCPKGYLWVIRTISGVGTTAAANRVRFALRTYTSTTSGADIFTWAWDTLTLPARTPNFQWSGSQILGAGTRLTLKVFTGNISFRASGWQLKVPPTTTPPT